MVGRCRKLSIHLNPTLFCKQFMAISFSKKCLLPGMSFMPLMISLWKSNGSLFLDEMFYYVRHAVDSIAAAITSASAWGK
jgi:hypothetical protein